MRSAWTVPERLAAACRETPEGRRWLEGLPEAIRTMQLEWSLSVGEPFDGADISCSWVAPVQCRDGTPAVLKLGMPHMEAADELAGLRFWAGDPTVELLAGKPELNAMLLERCQPGTSLREQPETEQDVVLAGLLRRLWRRPVSPYSFRPLSVMTASWAKETMAAAHKWSDAGLVREGLGLLIALGNAAADDVLLATDLHAGNVLRAQREPWLAIDPKPFVGDRAYDATQHLLNCRRRLLQDADTTIRRFADLLEVSHERVRRWTFARLAAEPRDTWDRGSADLARAVLGRRD